MVKNPPGDAGGMGLIPGGENLQEWGMATLSHILAWRIPWIEDLVGCSQWCCKKSDMIEASKHIKHEDTGACQVGLVLKNLTASAGDIRDAGSIPGLGRSPGEAMVIHFSNLARRILWIIGAWWATTQRVAKSWTQLKWFSTHTYEDSKDPLEKEWLPSPVFLPGESHGQRAWWVIVHAVTKSRTQLID